MDDTDDTGRIGGTDAPYRLIVPSFHNFNGIASGAKTIEGRLASRFFTGPAESPRLRHDAPRWILFAGSEDTDTDTVEVRVIRYTYYPTLRKFLEECIDDVLPGYLEGKQTSVRVAAAMRDVYLPYWGPGRIAAANGIAAVRFVRESVVARMGTVLWGGDEDGNEDSSAEDASIDAPGIGRATRAEDINRALTLRGTYSQYVTHAAPPVSPAPRTWVYPVRIGDSDDAVPGVLERLAGLGYSFGLGFQPNALLHWEWRDDQEQLYLTKA